MKSIVPFDEVVSALREVGNKMPRIYKETSEGGLANTPTGLRFKAARSRAHDKPVMLKCKLWSFGPSDSPFPNDLIGPDLRNDIRMFQQDQRHESIL